MLSLPLRIYNIGWGTSFIKDPHTDSFTLLEKTALSDIMQAWIKTYMWVERFWAVWDFRRINGRGGINGCTRIFYVMLEKYVIIYIFARQFLTDRDQVLHGLCYFFPLDRHITYVNNL